MRPVHMLQSAGGDRRSPAPARRGHRVLPIVPVAPRAAVRERWVGRRCDGPRLSAATAVGGGGYCLLHFGDKFCCARVAVRAPLKSIFSSLTASDWSLWDLSVVVVREATTIVSSCGAFTVVVVGYACWVTELVMCMYHRGDDGDARSSRWFVFAHVRRRLRAGAKRLLVLVTPTVMMVFDCHFHPLRLRPHANVFTGMARVDCPLSGRHRCD